MAHHDRRFYSIPLHRIIPYTREEGECSGIGEQVLGACKPGSVPDWRCRRPGDGHPSRRRLTPTLKQPTRGRGGRSPARLFGARPSIWPCSGWGLTAAASPRSAGRSYRPISPLPVLTDAEASGPSAVCFCATFHRTALSNDAPGRYPAPCPWSPDFPPRLHAATCAAIRPPALLAVGNYKDARR